MKVFKNLWLFLLLFVGFLACNSRLNAQYSNVDIAPANGVYSFSYSQIPDNIVPRIPTVTGTYVWESSPTPNPADFTPMGIATPSLSFNVPLNNTTYYRRKITISGIPYYSNTVEIRVVSINWEDLNYIRSHEVLVPSLNDWKTVDALPTGQKLQTTSYFDGLGRPVQNISREAATPDPSTPTLWGDIVQMNQYDVYGREAKKYLHYTTTAQPGKFKNDPVTDQSQYFTDKYNETSPFTTLTFDNTPLKRHTNLKLPGAVWSASSGNSLNYDMNDIAEDVQIFTIGYTSGDVPIRIGAYAVKTLYKTTYTDEKGKQVIEYYNNIGLQILRKVQIDDAPSAAHAGWICTYSVFDDFNLLRYRIQPEGVKYLSENSWSFAGTNGQLILNEQCLRYEYDEKGRNILKKASGADELYMIYDQRNRLVFVQDGNQRIKSPMEWAGTLYDELDRPTVNFLYRTNKTVANLKTDISNAAASTVVTVTNPATALENLVVDERQISIAAYNAKNNIEFVDGFESSSNDDFVAEINAAATNPAVSVTTTTYKNPVSSADLNNASITTILKYLFYDDYAYTGVKPFEASFDNLLAYPSGGDAIASSSRTLSMNTGKRIRILGTNNFLSASFFYDDKGRPIQSTEDNIKDGEEVTTFQYQFDNRILSTNTKHTASNSGYYGYSIVTKQLYDKIGRISSIEKKLGNNPFKVIVSYLRDDIGRLKTKALAPGYIGSGKNELESLTYSYNINNYLTGINKDYALKTPGKYDKWGNFFGIYLGYDNADGVFANNQLGGLVSGSLWTTMGDDAQRKYDFSYDNAHRLINAGFNEKQTPADSWSNAKLNFSVTGSSQKISYDLNGNLISMLQKGVVPGTSTPVTVDDLQYTYSTLSNKLSKVFDNGTLAGNNGKLGDFTDGANAANSDYVYDNNGNLVIDLNKNVKDLAGEIGGKGIRYNFLDKPEEIRISGKGTIKMVYDANGELLQKLFTPESTGTISTTTYIHQFVYQDDSLQYILFEEGRVRVVQAVTLNNSYDALAIDGSLDLPNGKRGAYDYYIKDYLGNTRMILTEETHSGSNACTMEVSRAANEERLFGQVDASGNPASGNEVQARFAVTSIPGQSGGGGWQNSAIGNHVSRIGNLTGKKVGPNSLLKIMGGDKISATALYYYQNAVVNSSGATTLLTNLLQSLGQAIAGGPATGGVIKASSANITSLLNSSIPFSTAVAPDASDASGSNPKAYLSIIFFDERFNLVSEGSVAVRVTQSGTSAPALVTPVILAPKNGYAYIYVSNESDEMVYFDNLQVSHERGRIIEENHYYAYGLKIASLSSRKIPDINEGGIDNNNLYNGKELIEEAELNWYDYGFRNYDPQIGRFPQLDPLTDSYPELTPFQYASNDPIANIDLDGLEKIGAVGGVARDFSYTYSVVSRSALVLGPPIQVVSATSTVLRGMKAVFSVTSMVIHTFSTVSSIINNSTNTKQAGGSSYTQVQYYWIHYTGTKVNVYYGDYGSTEKSTLYVSYPGTSGAEGGQNSANQNIPNTGPIPEGDFAIDLDPDFTRKATIKDKETMPGKGVELLPWGDGNLHSGWGLWRAELRKVNVNSTRDFFYFHDSYKGYSDGCVETSTDLYYQLSKLKGAGLHEIKVLVKYPDANSPTNGGTKQFPPPWWNGQPIQYRLGVPYPKPVIGAFPDPTKM